MIRTVDEAQTEIMRILRPAVHELSDLRARLQRDGLPGVLAGERVMIDLELRDVDQATSTDQAPVVVVGQIGVQL